MALPSSVAQTTGIVRGLTGAFRSLSASVAKPSVTASPALASIARTATEAAPTEGPMFGLPENGIPKNIKFLDDPREGTVPAPANLANIEAVLEKACTRESGLLNEHEVYEILSSVGVEIPEHHFVSINDMPSSAASVLNPNKKYVAKAVITGCTHKTDIGAVTFSITSKTASDTVRMFAEKFADMELEGVLFAEQLDFNKGGMGGGEWLISAYQDPFFGPTLAFGMGGTSVEYAKDVFKPNLAQIFIPACVDIDADHVMTDKLKDLPAVQILTGQVRGMKKLVDYETITNTLKGFQHVMRYFSDRNPDSRYVVREIEVNPAVTADNHLYALDGVLRVEKNPNFGKKTEAVPSLYSANKPIENIKCLLHPESCIVVGASNKNKQNPCSIILNKLKLAKGMKEENMYCLHPRDSVTQGVQAYPSFDEILKKNDNKPVDLLVVGVPAAAAAGVVKDALDKEVAKFALVISGGFSETEAGTEIQERIERQLAEIDARVSNGEDILRPIINGPNTVGSISQSGADTVFTPAHKSSYNGRGNQRAALIAQSGAFLISRLSDLANQVAPQISCSVGNQMDLSAVDFLEYMLKHDKEAIEDVNVVGIYVEGLKFDEGVRLMKLVGDAQEMGKHVVIYKAGRSKEGQEAAKGHTAAMAGDYNLMKHMLASSGALVCETTAEFENAMMLASMWGDKLQSLYEDRQREGRALTLAAVSNAGFEKGAIADHAFEDSPSGIKLTPWTPGTKKRIADIYQDYKLGSVVDVCDVLDVTPGLDTAGWETLGEVLLTNDETDVVILSMVPEVNTVDTLPRELAESTEWCHDDFNNEYSFFNVVRRLKEKLPHRPLIVSVEGGWKYDSLAEKIKNEVDVPVFRRADEAARCVRAVATSVRRNNK